MYACMTNRRSVRRDVKISTDVNTMYYDTRSVSGDKKATPLKEYSRCLNVFLNVSRISYNGIVEIRENGRERKFTRNQSAIDFRECIFMRGTSKTVEGCFVGDTLYALFI